MVGWELSPEIDGFLYRVQINNQSMLIRALFIVTVLRNRAQLTSPADDTSQKKNSAQLATVKKSALSGRGHLGRRKICCDSVVHLGQTPVD